MTGGPLQDRCGDAVAILPTGAGPGWEHRPGSKLDVLSRPGLGDGEGGISAVPGMGATGTGETAYGGNRAGSSRLAAVPEKSSGMARKMGWTGDAQLGQKARILSLLLSAIARQVEASPVTRQGNFGTLREGHIGSMPGPAGKAR